MFVTMAESLFLLRYTSTERKNLRRDITIFISYAHEDEQLCLELQKHLCLLQRVKDVKLWSDHNIAAGAEWEQEMSQYLDTAQIILLLISADFMAADHCYSIEMKRALERHEDGEAHVIPIILRPVFWKIAPFAKLQALPPGGEPVTSKNQDEAFSEIAQGILHIVEGKIQQPGSASISDGYRIDLGEAPDIVNFYGREEELATLKSWIVANRSKLVVCRAPEVLAKLPSCLYSKSRSRINSSTFSGVHSKENPL